MATQAEIETRIAALEKARASGIARVIYDGRTVEYRSVSEIERALSAERAALAAATKTTMVRHVRCYQDGKGL